jgi:hypothetical protein
MARHLLHDRDGALADERDRHRVGTHAVACDAAGGVGGFEFNVIISGRHPITVSKDAATNRVVVKGIDPETS